MKRFRSVNRPLRTILRFRLWPVLFSAQSRYKRGFLTIFNMDSQFLAIWALEDFSMIKFLMVVLNFLWAFFSHCSFLTEKCFFFFEVYFFGSKQANTRFFGCKCKSISTLKNVLLHQFCGSLARLSVSFWRQISAWREIASNVFGVSFSLPFRSRSSKGGVVP